jgi:hypothetical protein
MGHRVFFGNLWGKNVITPYFLYMICIKFMSFYHKIL